MKLKNFPNKAFFISAMIFFCFVSVNAFGKVDEHIKKTFSVKPGGLLTIETDLGAIEVNTSEDDTVKLEIIFSHKRGSRERFNEILTNFNADFQQSGDDVTVIVEDKNKRSNFWNSVGKYLKVRILVTVPEKYNLDLQTAGGSISVADIEGNVRTSTSGGSLTFGRVKGQVLGRTSGGSITLAGCEGNADLETSGGGIRIEKVTGDITAHTSGGSIDVSEVVGSITATTSGGSVRARISQQPKNKCVLSTSGGSITAYLSKDVKVNIDAGTSGGHVVTDFPVTAIMKGDLNNRSLKGTINGGGPELYLHTSGGSIHIRKDT